MPGVYKKKNCPYCGVEHRKRGLFCSKSHSNLGRKPEVYEKVSDFMKYTDKGQELTGNLKNQEIIDMPQFSNLIERPSNSFVSGGDLWMTDNSDW